VAPARDKRPAGLGPRGMVILGTPRHLERRPATMGPAGNDGGVTMAQRIPVFIVGILLVSCIPAVAMAQITSAGSGDWSPDSDGHADAALARADAASAPR
jgi:hypothetical protein